MAGAEKKTIVTRRRSHAATNRCVLSVGRNCSRLKPRLHQATCCQATCCLQHVACCRQHVARPRNVLLGVNAALHPAVADVLASQNVIGGFRVYLKKPGLPCKISLNFLSRTYSTTTKFVEIGSVFYSQRTKFAFLFTKRVKTEYALPAYHTRCHPSVCLDEEKSLLSSHFATVRHLRH